MWQQTDTFLSRLCLNSTHFSKELLLKFITDQDRVESWWDYILSSLKAFNFGPNFIDYIKTLYNDIFTAMINDGYISTWFQPERGVRQGCPISPYLFIHAVETLSSKIREDKTIKGISINGTEIKISQHADDTTCFIRDKYSLKHLLSLFARFKCCAGWSINVEKTVAKPLGIFQPESYSLCDLNWTTQNGTTLGVTIPANEKDHYLLNFKKRIKNMENLLKGWKCRHLSLKGKITAINTLASSPLLYIANTVHVPQRVFEKSEK